jgi:hypothetical protein
MRLPSADELFETAIKGHGSLGTASQEIVYGIIPARMFLIPVCELPRAFGTLPQGAHGQKLQY